MIDLLGKILGWLLGLLSPSIADRIRRQYTIRDVVQSVTSELVEMGLTTALLAWRIRAFRGTVDEPFSQWLSLLARKYNGVDSAKPELQALADPVKIRADAVPLLQRGPQHGLDLKEYSLPLLESQLSQLPSCPAAFRRQVLALRASLDLINADVRSARLESSRTFDTTLSPENRAAVNANLVTAYDRVAVRAEQFAKDVELLRPMSYCMMSCAVLPNQRLLLTGTRGPADVGRRWVGTATKERRIVYIRECARSRSAAR